MIERQVTLNKAAKVMKKLKEKSNSFSSCTLKAATSIDAISGKNIAGTRNDIQEQINIVKKAHQEIIDATKFFAEVKSSIISANVRTGLSDILCQIDMLKNLKNYLSNYKIDLQHTSLSTRGVTSIKFSEKDISSEYLFESLLDQIVQDITRQDSKTNYVTLSIELDIFDYNTIDSAIKEISKKIDSLEDEKYRINNTHLITLQIPDSIVEYLGIG